ncbi:MAG: signal recognition particle-docking protein FtsY, partial [Chloroflexi bacterium]|nr:signal recognition particle-docking protein FtsY [Chloroflexota bacterium]
TDELWDELEELLIQADVGVNTTVALVQEVRDRTRRERVREAAGVFVILKEEMVKAFPTSGPPALPAAPDLAVVLVVGVNGVGKTTSIAKLGRFYQNQGRQVVLAAGDTFRAAAIEQLQVWGGRLGVPVIAGKPGGDPGAVAFDAVASCLARGQDLLIVDTAGRLHTKFNLMEELKKVRRVVQKQLPNAPHATLLVIDATTGQNALAQAEHFARAVDVTGVVLAKLDGTAKGGMAFAIAREMGLPIQFVGTGETLDDLAPFDAATYVEALFA